MTLEELRELCALEADKEGSLAEARKQDTKDPDFFREYDYGVQVARWIAKHIREIALPEDSKSSRGLSTSDEATSVDAPGKSGGLSWPERVALQLVERAVANRQLENAVEEACEKRGMGFRMLRRDSLCHAAVFFQKPTGHFWVIFGKSLEPKVLASNEFAKQADVELFRSIERELDKWLEEHQ